MGLMSTVQEVIWDYAPSNEDRIRGLRLEDSEIARIVTVNGPGRIGHKYRKALYYGYTDATFKHRLPRPEWQGSIGPTIRAELDSEGAWYAGSGRGGRVEPGGRFLYTWEVPARAGPAQRDQWMDINAGLIGPIIIYRRGLLPGSGPEVGGPPSSGPALASQDHEFDREYVSIFSLTMRTPIPNNPHNSGPLYDLNDPKFMESNMMHGINGRIYGNLDGLVTRKGERVRWYLAAFGSMMDLHTAHFHGITVVDHGARKDTIDLLPVHSTQ
ncbi:Cupredoxin [Syncephalis plumigaleata]|nr:Cupredoxin [Syncephalis plumigaleata]